MLASFSNINGNGEIYLDVLRAICGDVSDKSMVDLGCCKAPSTPKLGFKERTYVDIQVRGLDIKEEEKYFIQSDVFDFLRGCGIYDVSIASDFIEHLSKEDGKILLSMMQQSSHKQIIFTPLGEYMTDNTKHPDAHQSGWMPEDFEGFASIVFTHFHPLLNIGAFFAFRSENTIEDFERVVSELKNKSWIK